MILIACEESQIVTAAFRSKGFDAFSCDILPTRGRSEWHIQCDVKDILERDWQMVIAFPPCTHLTTAGNRYAAEKIKDGRRSEAIDFFMFFVNLTVRYVAIENPVGIMSTYFRKPDQIFQPYMFGDPFQKRTCLWLKNLPVLVPTHLGLDRGEFYRNKHGKLKSKWLADCFRLPPDERSRKRSQFFPGVANAMAEQWGDILCKTVK